MTQSPTFVRHRAPLLAAALALLATLLSSLALASRAEAFVYWAGGNPLDGPLIGRADLDGSDPDRSFITGLDNFPTGVAVDDNYIYWADSGNDSIGRANLDGTGVDQGFITGLDNPQGLTVNDNYIYWAGSSDSIGRANLDGSGINEGFIGLTPPSPPAIGCSASPAVDTSFIYWGRVCFEPAPPVLQPTDSAIGRANLDGSGIDEGFIEDLDVAADVAVDDNYIYWADFGNDSIGRADLDGTGVDQGFITGLDRVDSVAVDANHVYWAVGFFFQGDGAIQRANLDGTGVNRNFISGAFASDLAVDALTFPETTISSGPEGLIRENSPSFAFESDKPGSTFECRLDSGAWSGCSSPQGYSELSDGPHTFRVRATDQEGTTDPSPAKRDFTVDTELKASAEAKRTQTRKEKILVKVKLRTKEEVAFAAASGRLRIQGSSYALKPEEKKVRASNSPKNLKLKPKKRGRKQIRKALNRGKTAKARVEVELSDKAGNEETTKLKIKLKRGS